MFFEFVKTISWKRQLPVNTFVGNINSTQNIQCVPSNKQMVSKNSWIANFGITLSFPIFLATIGLAGAYGIYAICALMSVFFVLKFVYETKGRTLEQMEG